MLALLWAVAMVMAEMMRVMDRGKEGERVVRDEDGVVCAEEGKSRKRRQYEMKMHRC